jgi:hypothetical protein
MNKVRLIVIASNADSMRKCGKIVNNVKRSVNRSYINIEIVVSQPMSSQISGISINGEEIIPCTEDDTAIDTILEKLAESINKAAFEGSVIAAATFTKH